jgi:hypothetical protein
MAAHSNGIQIEQIYASLTPGRQLSVITTVQQGIEATPPRSKATFSLVTLAHAAEQELIEQAKSGKIGDRAIQHYQSLVEQAGGILANGISSTGSNSLQSFREHTFRQLEIILDAASAAFLDSLNIWIQDQPCDGIDSLLERTFYFFSTVFPSIAGEKYNLNLATHRLIPDLQLRLFETLKLVLSHGSGSGSDYELQPLIESINAALQAEFSVVERVNLGEITVDDYTNLGNLIDQAGGELYYQIYSRGQNSVSELAQSVDQAITHALPAASPVVKSTYQRYLKLRKPSSLDDIFALSYEFIAPIAANSSGGPISSLQSSRQVRLFETIQQLLLATGFARKPYSAVFDISKSLLETEQNVLKQAQSGEDFTEELINFESLLLQASGVLAIDSTCASPAAVYSFVNDYIKPLRAGLSSPIAQAALSALRARSRSNPLAGTASLIELSSEFLAAVTKSLALVQTPELIPTSTPTGEREPEPEASRDWTKSVFVPPVQSESLSSDDGAIEALCEDTLQQDELPHQNGQQEVEPFTSVEEIVAQAETDPLPIEPAIFTSETAEQVQPAFDSDNEHSDPVQEVAEQGSDQIFPPLSLEPFSVANSSSSAQVEDPDIAFMINSYLATWDDQEGIDKVLSYLEDSSALVVGGGKDQLRSRLNEYRSLINKLVKEGRSSEEIEKELIELIRVQ